jgi:hypothetical protein
MHFKNFLNTGLSTAIFLLVILGIFALPTWIPLLRRKPGTLFTYRFALRVTAISQAVQACFVLGAGTDLVPLSYSRLCAALGLPLSVVGAGFACSSLISSRRGAGCLVSAIVTTPLWLLLTSMH